MSRKDERTSWMEKLRTIPRRGQIVGVAVILVLVVAYVVAFQIDEPLRR